MLYIHPHTVFVLEQYYSMLYLIKWHKQEVVHNEHFDGIVLRQLHNYNQFALKSWSPHILEVGIYNYLGHHVDYYLRDD